MGEDGPPEHLEDRLSHHRHHPHPRRAMAMTMTSTIATSLQDVHPQVHESPP